MKFITIRDLRSNIGRLREQLVAEEEIVVTANGRPFAVLTPVDADSVEDEINAIRRARAQAAVSRIRAGAKREGLDALTMEQVDQVIARARRERAESAPDAS